MFSVCFHLSTLLRFHIRKRILFDTLSPIIIRALRHIGIVTLNTKHLRRIDRAPFVYGGRLFNKKKRRFVVDVTFLFKTLNGHLDFDFSQFLDFYSQENRYLLRHFDNKSLKKKCARTNILKNSYFYRTVDEWNSLPFEVRSACSVDKFKANVIKFVTKL